MDAATVQALRKLNNSFYLMNRDSFSRSRSHPWPGWDRIAALVPESEQHLEVLDVACGNMRFERFLSAARPECRFTFTCLDSCEGMGDAVGRCRFIQQDIIGGLLEGSPLVEGEGRSYDLVACFGFLHHVPTEVLRLALVRSMVEAAKPGGLVAFSLWRFMDDEKLARKALATTERGCDQLGLVLDEGDYLLDWNGDAEAYRYCHSFDDGEIARILESVAQTCGVVARYRSDGKSSNLNTYIVLNRQEGVG